MYFNINIVKVLNHWLFQLIIYNINKTPETKNLIIYLVEVFFLLHLIQLRKVCSAFKYNDKKCSYIYFNQYAILKEKTVS